MPVKCIASITLTVVGRELVHKTWTTPKLSSILSAATRKRITKSFYGLMCALVAALHMYACSTIEHHEREIEVWGHCVVIWLITVKCSLLISSSHIKSFPRSCLLLCFIGELCVSVQCVHMYVNASNDKFANVSMHVHVRSYLCSATWIRYHIGFANLRHHSDAGREIET